MAGKSQGERPRTTMLEWIFDPKAKNNPETLKNKAHGVGRSGGALEYGTSFGAEYQRRVSFNGIDSRK